ncbi:hypothetical protein AVEN_132047-1 [Araneus ventricosus]|uniref:Uncharacterized protein n=1 Tax=Araneus ventricosus TaxID=182803 RepID=A0A4Y2KP54_ARAVE|nr:hypothetical protein AVEN_132047-1 [Araneus ventricosus]
MQLPCEIQTRTIGRRQRGDKMLKPYYKNVGLSCPRLEIENHQIDSIGSADPKRGRSWTLGLHRRERMTSHHTDLLTLLNLSTENRGERNKKRETPSRGTKENIGEDLLFEFLIRE